MNPGNGGWVILLSIFIAFILAAFHLPETWPQWLGWWRPSWVLLVIFFWVLELPHRMGMITAWFTGLFVDVLTADPLGLNAVLLAAATYLTWKFYERIRMYALMQQCLVVFALVLGSELLRQFIHQLLTERALHTGVFGIAIASALCWPLIYLVLSRLRWQARVE